MLPNDNNYIKKAITRESNISYEISHYDREMAKGAWKFARTTGHDFNVHLSFNFETDVNRPALSIKKVRVVSHRLRMWFRTKGKQPSNILWTRFVAKGSSIEQVNVLVHVPESLLENFKKVVTGWDLGIAIEPASYQNDQFFAGKACTIFDLMFKAVSNETRVKEPNVPAEASSALVGPRFFNSVKLWFKARRRHRAANARMSIDGTYSIIDGLTA